MIGAAMASCVWFVIWCLTIIFLLNKHIKDIEEINAMAQQCFKDSDELEKDLLDGMTRLIKENEELNKQLKLKF